MSGPKNLRIAMLSYRGKPHVGGQGVEGGGRLRGALVDKHQGREGAEREQATEGPA